MIETTSRWPLAYSRQTDAFGAGEDPRIEEGFIVERCKTLTCFGMTGFLITPVRLTSVRVRTRKGGVWGNRIGWIQSWPV